MPATWVAWGPWPSRWVWVQRLPRFRRRLPIQRARPARLRELVPARKTVKPASATSSGELARTVFGPATGLEGWQAGGVLGIFFGNGTAANPNGGILIGNGYCYTGYAGACTSGACKGGNGGLIGV